MLGLYVTRDGLYSRHWLPSWMSFVEGFFEISFFAIKCLLQSGTVRKILTKRPSRCLWLDRFAECCTVRYSGLRLTLLCRRLFRLQGLGGRAVLTGVGWQILFVQLVAMGIPLGA